MTEISPKLSNRGRRILSSTVDDSFFRNVIGNLPGAVLRYRVKADGTDDLLYISDAAAQLWGVPRELALKDVSRLWTIIPEPDITNLRAHLQTSSQELKAFDTYWRIRLPNARSKWLRGIAQPERQPDESIVWDTLILDVTDLKQAQNQLRVALETSRQGLWQWQPSTDQLVPLENWLLMTGYSKEEVGSMAACYEQEVVHPDDIEQVQRYLETLTHGEFDEAEIEFRIRKKNGEYFWSLTRASVTERDPSGLAVHIIGTNIDISEKKQIESRLRIAASSFDSHGPMIITDPDAKVLQINEAFTEVFQYQSKDVVGKDLTVLRSDRHDKSFYQSMRDDVVRSGRWEGEVWRRRKDGTEIPTWGITTAVVDERGVTTHHVGTIIDISQRILAEREVERLAFYDPLTGLPNRRYLVSRIEAAVAIAERRGSQGALLFLDLDHFKTINDSLGHSVGDELLVEVAARLQRLIRQEDVVSRLGGDEFVILINEAAPETPGNNAAGVAFVDGVAARIAGELRRVFLIRGREVHMTGTIGIAMFPQEIHDASDYLRFADAAMYQGKSAGRNTFTFYQPIMSKFANARLELEQDLRLALNAGQFAINYQPQFNPSYGFVGAEALLRWRHPQRGYVSPDTFVPIAEACGLIEEIGTWVLENACAQLGTMTNITPSGKARHLSVNVSSLQFRNPDFVQHVRSCTLELGASPERIILELTERAVIENIDETVEKMSELRRLGFRISLDDFGIGYSSLSYLRRLPLDQLKIDRSFIAAIGRERNADAIVQTIIEMGTHLGLDIVAEGVESQTQYEFLRHHGCTLFQGFLFHKPMTASEFGAFCSNDERS